jgi:hypothetical protein
MAANSCVIRRKAPLIRFQHLQVLVDISHAKAQGSEEEYTGRKYLGLSICSTLIRRILLFANLSAARGDQTEAAKENSRR